MNCNEIETRTPLYLSGELDSPRALEFSRHLKHCRACAAELQWQRHQDSVLRNAILSQEIETAAFDQGVRHQIARRRWPWAVAAAGLAAAIVLGIARYYAVFALSAPPFA